MGASGSSGERPRVLLLTATGYYPPFIEEVHEKAIAGEVPRVWLYDLPYDITFLDQRFLTQPPRWLRRVYDRLPMSIAQAIEAFRVQDDYDCIFAWGAESVSLPLALMLRLFRRTPPLVGIFGWVSVPKKARLIRAARPKITSFIIPTIVQANYAVQHLKVPADRVVFFHWPVDIDFWQSQDSSEQEQMICSAARCGTSPLLSKPSTGPGSVATSLGRSFAARSTTGARPWATTARMWHYLKTLLGDLETHGRCVNFTHGPVSLCFHCTIVILITVSHA